MEQDKFTNEPLESGNQNDDLKAVQEKENDRPLSVRNTEEQITEARDWQIDCNLNTCLLNVHVNSRWTDITINCGDSSTNRPLKAHKNILASRSPVFEAMFFGPCNEGKTEFDFPDTNVDIFDKMLRFMYTDDANLERVDEAIDLLQMAHMYQITYLVDHCALFLRNNLTPSNVCKTLDCALKYDLTMLRDVCCQHIDLNVKTVIATDEFLNVSRDGLAYILKGDTFYAPNDVIYHRIEQWAKTKLSELGKEETGQNVRDILGDAFYHLRLPIFPKQMIQCIKKKGYFTVDEYEDIIEYNLGCLSKLDFMSDVRRVPVEQILVVLLYTYDKKQEHRTVQQTLQIKLDKTVRLKYIEIPLFEIVMTKRARGLMHGSQKLNEEETLPADIGVSLSVVVRIDKIGFKQTFNVHQTSENSTRIKFDEPLQLKKRNSPFDLHVTIEPTCRSERVMLIGTSITVDLSYSSKDKETHHIGLWTSGRKDSFITIKAVGIENYSFREIEEDPEEANSGNNVEVEIERNQLCSTIY